MPCDNLFQRLDPATAMAGTTQRHLSTALQRKTHLSLTVAPESILSEVSGSIGAMLRKLLSLLPVQTNQHIVSEFVASSSALQSLSVQGLRRLPLPQALLESIKSNTSLTKLDIGFLDITLPAATSIAERQSSMSPLVSLRLTGVEIQSDALSVILEFVSKWNRTTDFCLASLTLLKTPDPVLWCRLLSMCTSLTSLTIESSCWISSNSPLDVGLAPLSAALACLTALRKLSFRQEYQSGGQVVVYSVLTKLSNLEVLQISSQGTFFIDTVSSKAISNFLKTSATSLRELEVGSLLPSCVEEMRALCSGLSCVPSRSLKSLRLVASSLRSDAALILAAAMGPNSFLFGIEEFSLVGRGGSSIDVWPQYSVPMMSCPLLCCLRFAGLNSGDSCLVRPP